MSIPRAIGRPWTAPSTAIGSAVRRGSGGQGFTLIELIIVFALIGILVGLGLPQYKTQARRGREAVLKEDLFQFRKLIDQHFVDKGKYPATLQSLVDEGYLRSIPVDPMTKSATTWVEVREELTEENFEPGFVPGVVDVRSGSQEKSLDGTPYNTW